MKIVIEIPEDFEKDLENKGLFGSPNKFVDFFKRVQCTIEDNLKKGTGICGNYELESAEMFAKAFSEVRVLGTPQEEYDKWQKQLLKEVLEDYGKE